MSTENYAQSDHRKIVETFTSNTGTPPAGAEDDWPNTNGRVVDAAGNALPNSVAGAEPSPEEAAAREYTDSVVALIQKHKGSGNMSEYKADVSNLAALIARHFAPLRAELERVNMHGEAVTRGINSLWTLLEGAGFVPCNNGWLDESRRAINELLTLRAQLALANARIASLSTSKSEPDQH